MRRLAVLLLLTAAAAAQDPLDAALAAPRTSDLADVVRTAILADGSLDAVLEKLEAGEPGAAELWVAARLRRRRGDLAEALRWYERLTELEGDSFDAWWGKARLLDALGRTSPAREAYERAAKLAATPADAERLALRLAMLPGAKDDLVPLARKGDAPFRNRAANVLALLDKHKDALELLVVGGEGRERCRLEMRRAQWALAAKDAAQAQAAAWRASVTAEIQRDRLYALALLVESHRLDKSLDKLVDRFAQTSELSDDARGVWIDLLREMGRVDEAIRLFRAGREAEFTVEMRRELLEMCRESGRDDLLATAYAELMKAEPRRLEWPEGLSRFYLERARGADARALWAGLLPSVPPLPAAEVLLGLGLDELAMECAERAAQVEDTVYPALLFLSDLHRQRGRLAEAAEVLDRIDARAPPNHAARMPLAEAYERLGRKKRASDVLAALREARGPETSEEDLDMRLAVLLSEIGEEERAMAMWRSLWAKVESPARRSYVEDRLLNVASRLGKLADIAIELEEKMADGSAGQREAGLLIQLYSKANDAVSAAEIIEEYVKRSGGGRVKSLKQKARVYLSCTDYYSYEQTVRELMKVDPDNAPDYLRQLAMSNLERAQPTEARKTLAQLKGMQRGSDAVEFEAGVLALAGLYDDAMAAYRRGIVTFPNRIEAYLLLGDLMNKNGLQQRAVGMFQHLAETADKDDLFTIAIDGLLNVDAPAPVIEWARRITLERLAGRHEKIYLYQLLADLAEQARDKDGQLRALEGGLPIAGSRRSSILRELMDLASAGNQRPMYVIVNGVAQLQAPASRAPAKKLAFGRRLLRLGDVVPPDVYLGLGQSFLSAGAVSAASKTFALARDLPDYVVFQRQVAALFEKAGYPEEALRIYANLLIGESSNIDLIAKVGEMHEAAGRDAVAGDLYLRAIDLMLARRPFTTVAGAKREPKRNVYVWRSGNVDDFEQYYDRVLDGLLSTIDGGDALAGLLAAQDALIAADLERAAAEPPKDEKEFILRRYPRLYHRARFVRRVAMAFGAVATADDLDRRLLASFPDDPELLDDVVRDRVDWGLVASARALIGASGRPDDVKQKNRFLTGSRRGGTMPATVTPAEAGRLFLPLILAGREKEARDLLARTAFTSVKEEDRDVAPLLVAVAVYLNDPDAALTFGRHWLTSLIRFYKQGYLEGDVRRVLTECWVVLPDQHRKSLGHSLVDVALSKPARAGMLLRLVAQLQRSLDTALIDEDQIGTLVREGPASLTYQPGPLLEAVPPGKRLAILRELWGKVQKSRQAQFLLQLLQDTKEPITGEVAGFVRTNFAATHGTIPAGYGKYLVVNALMNNEAQASLALELATVLAEAKPNDIAYRITRVGALHTAGRKDEARVAAAEAYQAYIALGKPDAWSQRAANQLIAILGEDASKVLLAAIDGYEKKNGATRETFNQRITILQRGGDQKAVLAALEAELAKTPDDVGMQDRVARQLAIVGRMYDSLLLLEKMLATHPTRADIRRRIESGWKRYRNPLRAAKVEQEKPPPADIEADEDGPAKVAPATIPNLKKAIDAGDTKGARAMLRRYWRGLGQERPRYYAANWRLSNLMRATWPAEPAKPDERPRASRGGLPDFAAIEERAQQPSRPTMFDALAAHDFAEPELRRFLRMLDAGSLDMAGPLFNALAKARVRKQGKAAAVREAVAAAQAAGAGKREVGVLLKALELAPEELGEGTADVLDRLSTSLNPLDTDQTRRLAAVYARTGDSARGGRLFRWSATQLHANSDWYRRMSPNELVDECCDLLEGDERVAVVEAVLRSAAPHLALGYNYNAEDNYKALVLNTWERVLGIDAAFAKCRALCDEIAAKPLPTRRMAAKTAARMFARAGETDAALRCLETAICELPPETIADANLPPYYGTFLLNARFVSYVDLARLFPAKTDGWKDARAWLTGAAAAIEKWLAVERLQRRSALQALTVIALRLHEHGAAAEAAALFDRVRAGAEAEPGVHLWLADVARATGRPEVADAIERALLDEKRLNLERIPEVVARVQAADGAAAALALGEAAAEYTLHPGLLDALVKAATAAGRPDRAKHWIETKAKAWPPKEKEE